MKCGLTKFWVEYIYEEILIKLGGDKKDDYATKLHDERSLIIQSYVLNGDFTCKKD